MKNKVLYQKISSFMVTPEDKNESFLLKLSNHMSVKRDEASHLYEEYLRFVYLTQISTVELTPSKQIDEVWHLHLTYTQNYWNIFCKDILNSPLHHNPGSLTNPKDDEYNNQYLLTLDLYQSEFDKYIHQKYWKTPKSNRKLSYFTFSILSLILMSITPIFAESDSSTTTRAFIFFSVIVAIFIIVAKWGGGGGGRNGNSCSGSGGSCSGGSSCGGGGCGGGGD